VPDDVEVGRPRAQKLDRVAVVTGRHHHPVPALLEGGAEGVQVLHLGRVVDVEPDRRRLRRQAVQVRLVSPQLERRHASSVTPLPRLAN
jgi:hypothetical protein